MSDTWTPWQIQYLTNHAETMSDGMIAAVVQKHRRTVGVKRKELGLPKFSQRHAKVDPLVRDNGRAKIAGLSYGQYKARQFEAAQAQKYGRRRHGI